MFCQGNNLEQSTEPPIKAKKIQNYLFKYSDKIGQGNFSKVYLGEQEKSGQLVAIKVIEATSIKSKVLSDLLQNQIQLLHNFNHHNVIKCYDVLTSLNNCYIITQYCQNGDLEKIIKKNKRLDQKDINKLVYDIYNGLLYLSNNYIIHRDLKLANVFLTANNTAKIADFGFAVKATNVFKDMSIGSPIYMSPQGLIKYEYGPKTDVWSFGVLLYELVHGDTPLSYCRTEQQLKNGVVMPPKFKVDISKQLKQIIQLCMNPSQRMRITMQQLQNTPYIRRVTSFVEGVKMPKEMLSTNHTSQKTIRLYKQPNIFTKILTYEDALALIHYGRLIHKTLKITPSIILSQWLITISNNMLTAIIDPKCDKINKVAEVFMEYNKKYQKEHLVQRIDRNVEEALFETQCMLKAHPKITHLQVIQKQTELLRKYLKGKDNLFGKYSISESFLSKL